MNLMQLYCEPLVDYLGAEKFAMVGSTYILGIGNDIDLLFKVSDLSEAASFLHRKGWDSQTEEYDKDNQFMSFKGPDKINILITTEDAFFVDFCRAAEVCRYLAEIERLGCSATMDSRAARVAVHKIIRDGAAWDEV